MNTFDIHIIMLISMPPFMNNCIDDLFVYVRVSRTYVQ